MNYWERFTASRVKRRRVLAGLGVGGVALAGTALLGCGDSGSNATGPTDRSGLLFNLTDTLPQAKRGGTLKHFNPVDLPNLDFIPSASSGTIRNRIYQKLLMPKPTRLGEAFPGAVQPDAAASWEYSPDQLQLTLKLHPENRFDPRPPTNGRKLDSQDVVFSTRRVEAESARRTDLFKSVNPDAPIESYSAPDPLTFVIKFAYPDAGFLANLATQNSGFIGTVQPVEAENGGVNIRSDPRGSGPYFISKYIPSATIEFDRNPGYFDKQLPSIDRIEAPIVTEYATRLSQFRAGTIHTIPVNATDILPTKQAIPDLILTRANELTAPATRMLFGFKPGSGTPFRDERVRQAFAHAIDRDLYIEALYETATFKDAGLDVETGLSSSAVPANQEGWWLNPRSKDFGANSKYFTFDVAEAKKLLNAAGFPNGIDVPAAFEAAGDVRTFNVIIGMVSDAGIQLRPNPLENRSEYSSVYSRGRGNYDGLAFGSATGGADPGNQLYAIFHSNGSVFPGFDVNGSGSFAGDPTIDDYTLRIRQEFDINKRLTYAHELQRYEAKRQYSPFFPGGARGFNLSWPALANFGVYGGQTDAVERTWWIDETKAPVRRG